MGEILQYVQPFWTGFGQASQDAVLYLALVTAGLWAEREHGTGEEIRLTLALIVGLAIGIGLTAYGISVTFPAWTVPLPLILLGLIAALQSPMINSLIALLVLLAVGIYFGLGREIQDMAVWQTVGVGAGAVMSFASGIGLGIIFGATVGRWITRVFGLLVAIAGVLMFIE